MKTASVKTAPLISIRAEPPATLLVLSAEGRMNGTKWRATCTQRADCRFDFHDIHVTNKAGDKAPIPYDVCIVVHTKPDGYGNSNYDYEICVSGAGEFMLRCATRFNKDGFVPLTPYVIWGEAFAKWLKRAIVHGLHNYETDDSLARGRG